MAIATALVACGADAPGGPGTPAASTHAEDDGHGHDESLRDLLAENTGAVRFRGVVLAHDPARWSSGQAGDGIVYVPVRIRVDAVYRGSLRTGTTTVVRRYGGVVDGTPYDNSEQIDLGELAPGRTLLVFADPPVRTPDGVTAMAPTEVLVVEGDQVRLAPTVDQVGSPAAGERLPLAEAERIARAGPAS